MNIFNDSLIKGAMSLNAFKDFIKKIICSGKLDISKALDLPWEDYQASLSDSVLQSLNNFKKTKGQISDTFISSEGLKGIYFSLGDDGLSLSIGGSLYYNESDWAANADFYPEKSENIDRLFLLISKNLILFRLDKKTISELLYLFSAFTINKTMQLAENITEIANAGIVLGYSDGDELILGHFVKNKFIANLSVVENGDYEKPSTVEFFKETSFEPRGPIWSYLHSNYRRLIEEKGLGELFNHGGEVEAEKLSKEFETIFFINRCKKCGSIKKTPKANLCLYCGDFSK